MIVVLIIVLIAITFGFVFAKLDTLTKACKILRDDTLELQDKIKNIEEKK